jgi:hypothetical protein
MLSSVQSVQGKLLGYMHAEVVAEGTSNLKDWNAESVKHNDFTAGFVCAFNLNGCFQSPLVHITPTLH